MNNFKSRKSSNSYIEVKLSKGVLEECHLVYNLPVGNGTVSHNLSSLLRNSDTCPYIHNSWHIEDNIRFGFGDHKIFQAVKIEYLNEKMQKYEGYYKVLKLADDYSKIKSVLSKSQWEKMLSKDQPYSNPEGAFYHLVRMNVIDKNEKLINLNLIDTQNFQEASKIFLACRNKKLIQYTESYSDCMGNLIGPVTAISEDFDVQIGAYEFYQQSSFFRFFEFDNTLEGYL